MPLPILRASRKANRRRVQARRLAPRKLKTNPASDCSRLPTLTRIVRNRPRCRRVVRRFAMTPRSDHVPTRYCVTRAAEGGAFGVIVPRRRVVAAPDRSAYPRCPPERWLLFRAFTIARLWRQLQSPHLHYSLPSRRSAAMNGRKSSRDSLALFRNLWHRLEFPSYFTRTGDSHEIHIDYRRRCDPFYACVG